MLNQPYNSLKLGGKLNFLLISIFLLILIVISWALSVALERKAEQIVSDQASILMATMSAVRNYTSTEVNPELAPRLETEDRFLPQTVPGYSARQVFEQLRSQDPYREFFYKEATLNPTNPRDKADAFESDIVEGFRDNTTKKELSGFRALPVGKIFYVARPISVSKESCLRCHSTPQAAPKSQILTYGSEGGFGWQLNEVVGAQVVSVPASQVFQAVSALRFIALGVIGGLLVLALVVLNLSLKVAIVNPLRRMARIAQQVSTGDMTADFQHSAKDEIGALASSLNRMKVSLQMAMEMLSQEQHPQ